MAMYWYTDEELDYYRSLNWKTMGLKDWAGVKCVDWYDYTEKFKLEQKPPLETCDEVERVGERDFVVVFCSWGPRVVYTTTNNTMTIATRVLSLNMVEVRSFRPCWEFSVAVMCEFLFKFNKNSKHFTPNT
jgi:hypothetical protein